MLVYQDKINYSNAASNNMATLTPSFECRPPRCCRADKSVFLQDECFCKAPVGIFAGGPKTQFKKLADIAIRPVAEDARDELFDRFVCDCMNGLFNDTCQMKLVVAKEYSSTKKSYVDIFFDFSVPGDAKAARDHLSGVVRSNAPPNALTMDHVETVHHWALGAAVSANRLSGLRQIGITELPIWMSLLLFWHALHTEGSKIQLLGCLFDAPVCLTSVVGWRYKLVRPHGYDTVDQQVDAVLGRHECAEWDLSGFRGSVGQRRGGYRPTNQSWGSIVDGELSGECNRPSDLSGLWRR